MKKIGLIFENNKELVELLAVLENLQKNDKIYYIKIISPTNIYMDSKANELLSQLSENTEVFYLQAPTKKEYFELSKLEKIIFLLKTRKIIKNYFNDVCLVLSGVQTIFSRIMYKATRRYRIPFFVYHRHLIFSCPQNSTNRLCSNSLIQSLLFMFNLDEFFIPTPNVGFADKYLVLGELNKKYLMDHKVADEAVHATGSLEYDNISRINIPIHEDKRTKVCYVTSSFERAGNQLGEKNQVYKIEKIIEFIKNNDVYELAIRVHPRERYQKYQYLQEKYPFIKLEYPIGKSVIEDLAHYDLIVGWFSTALFEIALLGKPILFYCLNNEIDEYKAILEHIPPSLVISNLDNGLAGHPFDAKKIILYDRNEKAADRIVNILKKQLNA
ncbi:hypothetical protein [Chrysiogenes arsenatis]|uniref:hypothetical protein n=1 Tax=Chrysiogenes arsenatis TaxID=309797 RepID=UPI0004053895|nr:hypothetical protein [Chrysiogenes arsenatis]